jgi:hypothetical protein
VPDFPPDDDICGVLETHVRRFFDDAAAVEFDADGAGMLEDEGNRTFASCGSLRQMGRDRGSTSRSVGGRRPPTASTVWSL